MRWVSWIVVLACGALSGCVPSAASWSPDGKWIAYLSISGESSPPLEPGWLVDPAVSSANAPVPAVREVKPGPVRYRLWVSRSEGTESILLLESNEPISSPAWSPDGKALTVSRISTDREGKRHLDCLVVRGPGQASVLYSEQIDRERPEIKRLPQFTPAWSPDGSAIAAPHADPPGLAVIIIATRQLSTLVEKGHSPSWSPDGARLAYLKRTDSDSVGVVDPRRGQPRQLLDVGQGDQAPIWTRDSQSLLVSARHTRPKLGSEPAWGEDAVLLRVQVDSGQIDPLRALAAERRSATEPATSKVSFVIDKEGENIFYSMSAGDSPSLVTWFRPREGSTFRKFPVIDLSIPINGLVLSPNGRILALKMGRPEQHLTPVLYDVEKNTISILVPDDESRQAWMAVLGTTVRSLLTISRDGLVRTKPGLVSQSPIPLPGELDENSEIAFRLRRIARLGRTVCSRDADLPPLPDDRQASLDEARLLFEYLTGDYKAALDCLARLEERAGTPDRNLLLLGLRAQVMLSLGDLESFSDTLTLLEAVEKPGRHRLDFQGGVARLTPIPSAHPAYSVALKNARRALEGEEATEAPRLRRSVDDPAPLGLVPDLLQLKGPLPPKPEIQFPR